MVDDPGSGARSGGGDRNQKPDCAESRRSMKAGSQPHQRARFSAVLVKSPASSPVRNWKSVQVRTVLFPVR